MSLMQKKVRDFHKAYGLLVNKTPTIPDDRTIQLRINLVNDEVKEFEDGAIAGDLENVIKELCDIDYVVLGAGVAYGIRLSIRDRLRYIGDLIRPKLPDPKTMTDAIALLRKQAKEFEDASKAKDIDAIARALVDLNGATMQIAVAYGVASLTPYFNEVHRSNMTKLWSDGTAHYRADGKVEKPPTYSKADIKSVMESLAAPKRGDPIRVERGSYTLETMIISGCLEAETMEQRDTLTTVIETAAKAYEKNKRLIIDTREAWFAPEAIDIWCDVVPRVLQNVRLHYLNSQLSFILMYDDKYKSRHSSSTIEDPYLGD